MNGSTFELTVGAAKAQYWIMSVKKEEKINKKPTTGLLYKNFVTINVDHQKKGSYKIYDTHDVVKEDRKTAICPRMLQHTNKKKQDIKEKINLQL